MPTLHAVLVAINEYAVPNHSLKGCVADQQAMHAFLQSYCEKNGLTYRPLLLANRTATREAVIASFGHFAPAGSGDQCLFYYAGHGARSHAPEAFHALESDKMLESIVCYDSRLPGGRDLMDKELSYLIWNALRDKDLPMITIADCCHSGRMRGSAGADRPSDVLGERQLREVGAAVPPGEFLGFEHYIALGERQVSPPVGRRVHLAAARDMETAREVLLNGQPRGIFTVCLLQVLEAMPLLSYVELAGRVQLRVRSNIAGQSPQLDCTRPDDKKLRFLGHEAASGATPYLVSCRNAADWTVNGGALHGFSVGDAEHPFLLAIDGHPAPVRVVGVEPAFSRLDAPAGLVDPARIYRATVARRPVPKIAVAVADGADPDGVTLLRAAAEKYRSDLFHITEQPAAADLLVHVRNRELLLTRLTETRPLFQRVTGYEPTALAEFLRRLEVVANWRQVLDLENPERQIADDEVSIQLARAIGTTDDPENGDCEPVDWRSAPVFAYRRGPDGTLHQPGFQLTIRNNSLRPLWFSLLYLGFDFSITNELLPKECLLPGNPYVVRQHIAGRRYRTIPLQIEAAFQRQGLRIIDESLKLLVSTDEFDTDSYNQHGLAADTGSAPRLRGPVPRRQQPQKRMWRTFDIPIQISLDPIAAGEPGR